MATRRSLARRLLPNKAFTGTRTDIERSIIAGGDDVAPLTIRLNRLNTADRGVIGCNGAAAAVARSAVRCAVGQRAPLAARARGADTARRWVVGNVKARVPARPRYVLTDPNAVTLRAPLALGAPIASRASLDGGGWTGGVAQRGDWLT